MRRSTTRCSRRRCSNSILSRISDNDIPRKLDAARRATEAVDRAPYADPEVLFQVRAALVEAEFYAGLGIHLEQLEGLDGTSTPRFPPVRTASHGDDLVGRLLMYDGRVDDGLATLRGMYERASVENRSILPAILGWMAEGQVMAGRFMEARDLTAEALDRTAEIGGTAGFPWEVGFHAVALARLGELDAAESTARQVVEPPGADPVVGMDGLPARLALGIVALGRQDVPGAVAQLRTLDAIKRQAGSASHDCVPAWAISSRRSSRRASWTRQREVILRLVDEAESSGSRWSSAVAARGEALLLAAHGRVVDAVPVAVRSRELLETLPMPFERARTDLLLGQLRRRRREKAPARDALRGALSVFEDLHASVWAARTRAELARIQGHATDRVLTPTEERVARLAAEGLTNREIAERAFLSLKTVEVNLTRATASWGYAGPPSPAGWPTGKGIRRPRRGNPDSREAERFYGR